MNGKLPESLRPYFWDVKFEQLSVEDSPLFILKRVLDRGDTEAHRWALSLYTYEDIVGLITTTRDVSKKTANFWAEMLDVDKTQVPCLQKPYSPTPFGLSS